MLASGLRARHRRSALTRRLARGHRAAGRAAAHRLERYLNTLGTIASAAPLLGLLGTVIGMIEIFGSQAPTGGSNPALLAHGISVALYNTAFGLIVAIPSLMFYRYFRGLRRRLHARHGAGGRPVRAAPAALRGAAHTPRLTRGRMNFRKPRPEEPEINLIPFIDVLLVILIFLMLSTTY